MLGCVPFSWVLQCLRKEILSLEYICASGQPKVNLLLDIYLLPTSQYEERPGGPKTVGIYSSKRLVNSWGQTSYMMWLVFQTDPYCCSADYRAVNHLKRRWLIASSQGHFCSDKIIYCFTLHSPKSLFQVSKEIPSLHLNMSPMSSSAFLTFSLLPQSANLRRLPGSGGRASIISSTHSVLKCRHHWSLWTLTHSLRVLSIEG